MLKEDLRFYILKIPTKKNELSIKCLNYFYYFKIELYFLIKKILIIFKDKS